MKISRKGISNKKYISASKREILGPGYHHPSSLSFSFTLKLFHFSKFFLGLLCLYQFPLFLLRYFSFSFPCYHKYVYLLTNMIQIV